MADNGDGFGFAQRAGFRDINYEVIKSPVKRNRQNSLLLRFITGLPS
jgi:hypothetical protein